MRILLIVLFACHLSINLSAQGEANNWYFGRNAGITFNTNPPSALQDGELDTLEGCSSISDSGGNLLFYTDGRTIWDRNHQIMSNADYFGGTGLHGDPSSTQSGLIVPHPIEEDIFYVFTVDEPHHQNAYAYPSQGPADINGNPLPYYEEGPQFTIPEEDDGFNNGLNYSIIDMSLRNGFGDVIQGERNKHLITYNENDAEEIKYKCSEKVTAVAGADCNSIWLITHFLDKFYAFLIDENGVDENPVISQAPPMIGLGGYRRNSIGYMKASPDGGKLILAHLQTSYSNNENGNVYLYDFDNATGEVSNSTLLVQNVAPYGVEFSSDSKKAYATSSSPGQSAMIYQWDLSAENVAGSLYIQNTTMPQATALQLGPNGKIYTPRISQPILNVINNPNELGAAMQYTENLGLGAISLNGNITTFGLPPFIQSLFTSRIDIISGSADMQNLEEIETEISVCDGETVSIGFEYESAATYQWFQNGQLIEDETNPFIEIGIPENQEEASETVYTLEIFPEEGECKLRGIANISFGDSPVLNNSTIIQCQIDIDNETAFFDLSNAKEDIIADSGLSLEDVEFVFFEMLDGVKTEISTEAITTYENTSNPQEILVEVTELTTRCKSEATIQLIVDSIAGTEEVELVECDTNLDGIQTFDLSLIAAQENLNPTFYYLSENDALQDNNRINNIENFTNSEAYEQIIYFRTEADESCGILYILRLSVIDLPFLFDDKEVFYCIEDSPNTIAISPQIPDSNADQYTYFWPFNNQESFSIDVNQPDTYQVLVTDIATGCEALQNIVVSYSSLADFRIEVNDGNENNNQLTVVVNPENSRGSYEYAIESRFGEFQDAPTFTNLAPGFYDVFVRDRNGCGVAHRTVGVVGAMRYFTPNNDGINDYWNLIGLPSNQNAEVQIFDRYGKLLTAFNSRSIAGWDGTYKGKLMPNNDYWYRIKLDDGRVLKGNFTLKR